jgi:hypothetical protein
MQACATLPVKPVEDAPIVSSIQVDSAFADFLAELREILPTERVVCLYGAVRGDTAWVNFAKPARMEIRTTTLAKYSGCPKPLATSTIAQYLGTWHNHNVPGVTWDDLCRFSDVDDSSFRNDRHAIIELLSCRGKLMARSKIR